MANTQKSAAFHPTMDTPDLFRPYLPLKQHSEPEDGAIEEEGTLEGGLVLHYNDRHEYDEED